MAKTTLNAKNLEALGVQRLAELLIEISTGSAANKRRLRLALAGSQSSSEVAREVRKRLGSIARARSAIGWRKVRTVKSDLEAQRRTIVDVIGPDDPNEAFEMIWQFLSIADSIFERSKDGGGSLIESFHQACTDAGLLALSAGVEPDLLADKVFAAIKGNEYGQYDLLIVEMAEALGAKGLAQLKTKLSDWSSEPNEHPPQSERKLIGLGSGAPISEHEIASNSRDLTIRLALQQIADLEGDVDAYIAQQPEATRTVPAIAAEIADRLVAKGRAAEALTVLDRAGRRQRLEATFEWENARMNAIDALGRYDEAQACRWRYFERSLNEDHLRAFLKRLPDFDDIEAEQRAFAYVHQHHDVQEALGFFLRWPALADAARLVVDRRTELDGDLYELMTPAADMLAEKYPLAATLVLRAMIDFTLDRARSSRYRHAARHLAECRSLAARIDDFGKLPSHDAYLAGLRQEHGGKSGFWSRT